MKSHLPYFLAATLGCGFAQAQASGSVHPAQASPAKADDKAATAPAAPTTKDAREARKETLLAGRTIKNAYNSIPTQKDPFDTPLFKLARPLN